MVLVLKERLARQASGDKKIDFDPTGPDEPRLVMLPLRLIDRDPNQPRKSLGDIGELAESISREGLVTPLIVEPIETGRYRLIAGERRLAASHMAGLDHVPCIVRSIDEQSRLVVQILENLHRKELHPVEEARAFKRLMTEFNFSQRVLAERLGKSLAAVNQTLRILNLNPDLLATVQTSEQVNKSVLLEIAKQDDPQMQWQLWEKAESGKLTVREAKEKRKRGPLPEPQPGKAVIDVPEAKIVIRFLFGQASDDRIRQALENAIVLHREMNCF